LTLSVGQLVALRNLADKQAGQEVNWINIADARMLTELGLAQRDREGWRITPEGLSALQAARADGSADEALNRSEHEIIPMRKAEIEGK
jgi:hypothetical protein